MGPEFDPGGVISAVMLYPFTVVICALVLCGAGVLVGFTRDPTYTASSELLVGNLSIGDPSAIPGAVGAAQALAGVYARLLDANDVQHDIAAKTAGDEPVSISASPVIESPLIEITAMSKSEDAAIGAANAAGGSLSAYVNDLRSPGGQTTQIVKQYREAQLRYQEKLEAFNQLKAQSGPNPTESEQQQINEASADVQAAKLKRASIAALYSRGQNIKASQPNLDLYERAFVASNDRGSKMQFAGALGLVAGLLLGAALATFRANRWERRAS
jgi:uncharacterized protein involved in exopolysaccharide biosynthesis